MPPNLIVKIVISRRSSHREESLWELLSQAYKNLALNGDAVGKLDCRTGIQLEEGFGGEIVACRAVEDKSERVLASCPLSSAVKPKQKQKGAHHCHHTETLQLGKGEKYRALPKLALEVLV